MGLTFNNIHSSVYGLGTKITRPLLPGNSDNYIDIPGRAGSILFPGKPKDKLIPVEFGFMPNGLDLFRSKVWEISAWLNTNDRKILIFDDEPSKTYMAKIEGQIDLEQIFVLGKFTAVFRCSPYAFGAEVTTNFINDSAIVINAGTVETPVVIDATFTAATTEFKVSYGTKYVRVVHNFNANDTLQINTENGAILHNSIRSMSLLDWQYSQFFELSVGNNTLNITPTGKCTATVKHIPRWL